jgi:hypothetical protein
VNELEPADFPPAIFFNPHRAFLLYSYRWKRSEEVFKSGGRLRERELDRIKIGQDWNLTLLCKWRVENTIHGHKRKLTGPSYLWYDLAYSIKEP